MPRSSIISSSSLEETVWLPRSTQDKTALPVAVLTGTGAAATYYVNPDHLGAPHIVTNNKGKQAWIWDHLAFGDNAPNQNPAGLGTFKYNFRFPGQYADSESGLNYNYFRDYNPSLGRYVESDPIGLLAGLNTYSYAKSNPLLLADTKGLQVWQPLLDEYGPELMDFGDSLWVRLQPFLYQAYSWIVNSSFYAAATQPGSPASFAAGMMCGAVQSAVPVELPFSVGDQRANQATQILFEEISQFSGDVDEMNALAVSQPAFPTGQQSFPHDIDQSFPPPSP